jgi:hypothetical protein
MTTLSRIFPLVWAKMSISMHGDVWPMAVLMAVLRVNAWCVPVRDRCSSYQAVLLLARECGLVKRVIPCS